MKPRSDIYLTTSRNPKFGQGYFVKRSQHKKILTQLIPGILGSYKPNSPFREGII